MELSSHKNGQVFEQIPLRYFSSALSSRRYGAVRRLKVREAGILTLFCYWKTLPEGQYHFAT